MSAPTQSWRTAKKYVALASQSPAARLCDQLTAAQRAVSVARADSRQLIMCSNAADRAASVNLRQQRQTRLDAAEAAVVRVREAIAEAERQHEQAVIAAAKPAIQAGLEALSRRLEEVVPEAMRLAQALAPLLAEINDVASEYERDFSRDDPVVRKSGAGLSTPPPIPCSHNLTGWLAGVRAAGWTTPDGC